MRVSKEFLKSAQPPFGKGGEVTVFMVSGRLSRNEYFLAKK